MLEQFVKPNIQSEDSMTTKDIVDLYNDCLFLAPFTITSIQYVWMHRIWHSILMRSIISHNNLIVCMVKFHKTDINYPKDPRKWMSKNKKRNLFVNSMVVGVVKRQKWYIFALKKLISAESATSYWGDQQ